MPLSETTWRTEIGSAEAGGFHGRGTWLYRGGSQPEEGLRGHNRIESWDGELVNASMIHHIHASAAVTPTSPVRHAQPPWIGTGRMCDV